MASLRDTSPRNILACSGKGLGSQWGWLSWIVQLLPGFPGHWEEVLGEVKGLGHCVGVGQSHGGVYLVECCLVAQVEVLEVGVLEGEFEGVWGQVVS